MAALDDKRFLIVTGKGGVGKTTVCAAEALALAHKGKRVLVAMCNAKERLSAMLGSDLIGEEVIGVAPNVWAVNMNPEKALEEYGVITLKSRALYKLLFDNKYVRTFFRAVPGMHEWAMLGKAWWHTTELGADGRPRFDVVILDAPATGHGLDMLRVPRVILDVVPPGLLRRDARAGAGGEPEPAVARAAGVPGVLAAPVRGRRPAGGDPGAGQARVARGSDSPGDAGPIRVASPPARRNAVHLRPSAPRRHRRHGPLHPARP